jgi:hypothetical protein
MVRGAFSSHSRYHLQDPHHQMTCEITVEDAHKTLLPPCNETDHDTPIVLRLMGTYLYDTCILLCPYTPCRRCHGVGRDNSLKPVRTPSLASVQGVDHLPSNSPKIHCFFSFFNTRITWRVGLRSLGYLQFCKPLVY